MAKLADEAIDYVEQVMGVELVPWQRAWVADTLAGVRVSHGSGKTTAVDALVLALRYCERHGWRDRVGG